MIFSGNHRLLHVGRNFVQLQWQPIFISVQSGDKTIVPIKEANPGAGTGEVWKSAAGHVAYEQTEGRKNQCATQKQRQVHLSPDFAPGGWFRHRLLRDDPSWFLPLMRHWRGRTVIRFPRSLYNGRRKHRTVSTTTKVVSTGCPGITGAADTVPPPLTVGLIVTVPPPTDHLGGSEVLRHLPNNRRSALNTAASAI